MQITVTATEAAALKALGAAASLHLRLYYDNGNAGHQNLVAPTDMQRVLAKLYCALKDVV